MIEMIATDQCSAIQVEYLTVITVNEMPELRWLYTRNLNITLETMILS